MIKKITFLLFVVGQFSFAQQNPILRESNPNFLYTADPAAEVFNGKVYLYCSHDQPDAVNYEGMKDYVILESSDLKNWINHGVSLDPQLDKGFEYAQSNMNAPDAAYKNGWYYWYFPSDITHVGVAKSKSPTGPWQSAVTNEITTIFDPTVIVDDDGQAYIFGNDHWVDIGEKGSHIMGAKLKDNMVELDGPWVRLTKETVNEAVHVFKRNGIFYFSARVGPITKYWMADSPLPKNYATFKGELAPNSPESPNHTSVIEFKKQWYLFYHRGDVNNGNRYKRSVCFDKITFRKDGTIEPIVYTLDKNVEITKPVYPKRKRRVQKKNNPKGKQVVFDAAESIRYEAEDFSSISGDLKIEKIKIDENSERIIQLSNKSWLGYTEIEFGKSAGPFSFRVNVSSPKEGAKIVVRMNSPTGAILKTIPIPSTGRNNYKTISTTINRVRGAQTIYLCSEGNDESVFNINWFEWTPSKRENKKN
jgi:hypothetical protein